MNGTKGWKEIWVHIGWGGLDRKKKSQFGRVDEISQNIDWRRLMALDQMVEEKLEGGKSWFRARVGASRQWNEALYPISQPPF